MSTWLKRFIEQLDVRTSEIAAQHSLYCLIDTVRQPEALKRLYQHDEMTELKRLFTGTPFDALSDASPIWLAIPPGTAFVEQVIELCCEHRAGILISSEASEDAAFSHAQRLLPMSSPEHGEALARFYDPAFWGALALTTQAPLLFGPWQRVYTPPPHRDDPLWRVWHAPEHVDTTPDAHGYPLQLGEHTLAAESGIQRWYWVRAHAAGFVPELRDEQLPTVLANLELLVAHGIGESRHLLRLIPKLSTRLLQDHPEFMSVLCSDLPAFEKVQQLETQNDRYV